jgi:hypothetical protein
MGGRLRAGLSVALLAIALLAAATASRAEAAVYWGAPSGLGAADLDGSNPQWDYFYVPFPSETEGPAHAVAITPQFIYWVDPSGIVRRRLEGEGAYPAAIVPNSGGTGGLTTDGSHLYWTESPSAEPRTGSIGRAGMDGSEATNSLVTGLEAPCAVTVEDGRLFWVESGWPSGSSAIGRSSLDGSASQRSFIPTHSGPSCGIAAHGGYLYWAEDEAIARADLEGGELDESFIPGAGRVGGLAVDSGHIYWVAINPAGPPSIGRANLDGSEVNADWIPSEENELRGIAVDERPTPPPLTIPSRPIEIQPNAAYNLRSGAALLDVYVPPSGPADSPSPPAGALRVVSSGLSWKVFPGSVPHAGQGGSYLWQVRIRSGRGHVGRRIRVSLRRRGWARAKVRLSYAATGVYSVEASRKLILRRYRGATAGWVKHPPRPSRR